MALKSWAAETMWDILRLNQPALMPPNIHIQIDLRKDKNTKSNIPSRVFKKESEWEWLLSVGDLC